MMTIVFNTDGRPIFTVDAEIDVAGYIVCESPPEGYRLSYVNVEEMQPVFEKIPETVEEQQQKEIDALKEQVAQLQEAAALQQQITDAIIGADETESEGTV